MCLGAGTSLLRNLLALIGLLTLVLAGVVILHFEPYISKARSLDAFAWSVYGDLTRAVLTKGDATEFLVYRKQVADGLDMADVEQRLAVAAASAELEALGSLAADRQISERFGREFPTLKIYLFCDPGLAEDLIRHNNALAAFFPCRVILHADNRGRLWLMTPNLDLVLHGGYPLPMLLRERALGLQAKLREIVDYAAMGQP